MRKAGTLRPDPTMIGNVVEPPYARLPDPSTIFATRAGRFLAVADGHELGPYLRFLSGISHCQHRARDGLPEPTMPADEPRAREHAMPPLDRSRFTSDAACDATLDRLFSLAAHVEMPDSARSALERVRGAGRTSRDDMVRSVLGQAIPTEAFAEHAFVAAALQVHFAGTASRLDPSSLVPISDGICPACGGAPVASAIVGWSGAHGARFCTCSLCATQWHVVRIKCVLCGSTEGITYHDLQNGNGNVKAETCESCHGYVKILHQHKDTVLEAVADDVASLGLDLKLRESGYRRGAFNPLLLGY